MCRELVAGGSERQLTETALGLDRQQFDPHVVCFRGSGFRHDELRAAGVSVEVLNLMSFKRPDALQAAAQFHRYVTAHHISLVHGFDVPGILFGVPLARLFRVPVVLSSQRAHRTLTPNPHRRLLRVTDRLAHGVVCNSQAMRRHLIDDERVPAVKVHVCPNGLDLTRFNGDTRQRVPALTDASIVVGSLCVLRPEKDLLTLVHAFARLHTEDENARLLLVGSGPEETRLRERVAALDLADACVFQPATADVVPWLHSIDIFVLPSLSEAFSNALMEAMACGCCPVASCVGGNPELVTTNETGLLFEAGNAGDLAKCLQRLASDPSGRQRMASQAQSFIRSSFSREAAVATMGRIYRAHLDRVISRR